MAKDARKDHEGGASQLDSQDRSTETRAIIHNACFGAQQRIKPLMTRH